MKRSWIRFLSFVVAIIGTVAATRAATVTVVSTIPEDNATFNQANGGVYIFTSGLGFDFTTAPYQSLSDITELDTKLTINDGDSDILDFDRNDLFLTLDGINTGVVLTGFTNGTTVTITFAQLSPPAGAAILAALKIDGRLVGGIQDSDRDGPAGDTINFPGTFDTTLTVTGDVIPEPATLSLAALAGLTLLRRHRRTRCAADHSSF